MGGYGSKYQKTKFSLWAHFVPGLKDSPVFDFFQREVDRCHVLATVLRASRSTVGGIFVCLTPVNRAAYWVNRFPARDS